MDSGRIRSIRSSTQGAAKMSMKKLHAWLMKLTFGIDLKCDKCGRVFETERGKNIHRASHLNSNVLNLYINKNGKLVKTNKIDYNPLEGQDVELFLRGNKKV